MEKCICEKNERMRIILKKVITMFLVSCLLVVLTSCSSGNSSSATPEPTSEPNSTISATEAEQIAKQETKSYFQSHQQELLEAAQGMPRVESIDLVNLATQEMGIGLGSGMEQCTLKGTFWGYDEYGETVDKFIFEWTMNVNVETKMVAAYSPIINLS